MHAAVSVVSHLLPRSQATISAEGVRVLRESQVSGSRSVRRWLGALFVTALLAAAFVVTDGVAPQSAQAAPINTTLAKWQCTPNEAVLVRGSNPPANQGIPATIDYTDAPFTFNNLTGPVGYPYNAIGWDIESQYVFGLGNVNDNGTLAPHANHLIQLGSDGAVVDLGIPMNGATPLTSETIGGVVQRWTIGAMDGSGTLYATGGSMLNIYKIDVSAGTFTTTPLNFSGTGLVGLGIEDWAFNPIDGLLYGVGFGPTPRLVVVNPVTGQVSTITQAGDVGAGAKGAVWFSTSGILYAYANASGGLYRFTDLTSAGTAELVSSGNPTASFFDGASCSFGASLEKEVTTAAVDPDSTPVSERGEVVTYTFKIVWTGLDLTISGVDLTDDLSRFSPQGIPGTYIAGSTTVAVNGGAAVAVPDTNVLGGTVTNALGGAAGAHDGATTIAFENMTLAKGTTTISVDVQIDPNAAWGDYRNQAVLTGLPSGFPDVPSDWPQTPDPGDPTPLRIHPKTAVTIQKIVQDEHGLNPQPGVGWTVDAAAVQADGTTADATVEKSPAGSQVTAQSTPGGPAEAEWSFRYLPTNASKQLRLKVAETMQPGYEFVSGECEVQPLTGAVSTVTLTAITQVLTPLIPADASVACAFTNKKIPGTVTWTKVDASANALAGSEWKLVGPSPATTEIAVVDCVSAPCSGADSNPAPGALSVTDLLWGQYSLIETVAPAGYVLDPAPHPVVIDATHTSVAVGAIVNVPGTVAWQKTDTDGQHLAASEWQIVGPDGASSTTTPVIDNVGQSGYTGRDSDNRAGYFKVEMLGAGDYTLQETSAPAGYVLDTSTHAFTLSAGATDYIFTNAFVNERRVGPSLPLTGGLGRDFYLLLGGVLVLVTVASSIIVRRRSARSHLDQSQTSN